MAHIEGIELKLHFVECSAEPKKMIKIPVSLKNEDQ